MAEVFHQSQCLMNALEMLLSKNTMENPSPSDQDGSSFWDFGKEEYFKNKLRMASCEQKYFSPLLLPIRFEI